MNQIVYIKQIAVIESILDKNESNADIGIDILHIYCPKYYESKDPINELLESYNNIFIKAKENNYKNIISVSIGTGVHGYKHNDIAKYINERLNYLINKYDIEFTLVLPNDEIMHLYEN